MSLPSRVTHVQEYESDDGEDDNVDLENQYYSSKNLRCDGDLMR